MNQVEARFKKVAEANSGLSVGMILQLKATSGASDPPWSVDSDKHNAQPPHRRETYHDVYFHCLASTPQVCSLLHNTAGSLTL